MKPRQRQAAILEFLQSQGKCSVEELAQHFDTTGTTIRKDLVTLENAGTVIRTYGGPAVSTRLRRFSPPAEMIFQPIVTTQCCCGFSPAIVVYTPVLWPGAPTAQTL